jgi:hypothetical protein
VRRFISGLFLLAAILAAGGGVAGCTGAASSAIAGASPSRGVSVPARPSVSSSPGSASKPSAPATAAGQPTPAGGSTTVTVRASSAVSASGSVTTTSGSGSSLTWLWILLGIIAVVLIVVVVWIIRAGSHRRSATAADWRSRVTDAYTKGAALHDAMSLAETPAAMGSYDAGARWSDIQRRADDLAQTLYALREAAPEEDQAKVTDVLMSLQAVRSAMGAERVPGGAGPGQAGVARERLAFFEMSLRALRTPEEQQSF